MGAPGGGECICTCLYVWYGLDDAAQAWTMRRTKEQRSLLAFEIIEGGVAHMWRRDSGAWSSDLCWHLRSFGSVFVCVRGGAYEDFFVLTVKNKK